MVVFVNANYGATAAEVRGIDEGTTPIKYPVRSKPSKRTFYYFGDGFKTAPELGDEEIGNEEETDQSSSVSSSSFAAQQAVVRRMEVASKLAGLAQKVIEGKGRVRMTADLLVLKKELARAHDVLRDLRSERDYLSVVTVVEAAIQNINWRKVSKDELEQIHSSLSIGMNPVPINFDDVNRQARQFRGRGVSTLPTFDIHDGEEDAVAEEEFDSTLE